MYLAGSSDSVRRDTAVSVEPFPLRRPPPPPPHPLPTPKQKIPSGSLSSGESEDKLVALQLPPPHRRTQNAIHRDFWMRRSIDGVGVVPPKKHTHWNEWMKYPAKKKKNHCNHCNPVFICVIVRVPPPPPSPKKKLQKLRDWLRRQKINQTSRRARPPRRDAVGSFDLTNWIYLAVGNAQLTALWRGLPKKKKKKKKCVAL